MVDLDAGEYLLHLLLEAGPFQYDAMGNAIQLSWADIAAYSRMTGELNEPWEARLIFRMSGAYIKGTKEGTDPFSIAPLERLEP